MPAGELSSQIKKVLRDELHWGFRKRGFRLVERDGLYARPFDGGTDDLAFRLQAGGRGSRRVDVLLFSVGITVHTAIQQAADLRGIPVNPNQQTVIRNLFDLASQEPDREFGAHDRMWVGSSEEAPRAAGQMLRIVDEVGEPWLRAHHDLPEVLRGMVTNRRGAWYPETLETTAVLAFQLGDLTTCALLLAEHEVVLAKLGAVDHPGYAPNFRWEAGMAALLAGDG